MSNPTWNWLVILASGHLFFQCASFLHAVQWNEDGVLLIPTPPRSCLLDKIRRHFCDNTLPFPKPALRLINSRGFWWESQFTRVKKPRLEILSQNQRSKTCLQIMKCLLMKQKTISVSTFWRSPCLWVSSGSNIQRMITLLSVFFRSNIANLYPRSTTKYWLSLTEHIYFEQSTKKYWLALTVRIFFVWNDAQLRSFLQRYFFHPEEASILAMEKENGWYISRTDYPMGKFVLKKKCMVDQNGRSACISNIFAQRITKMDENFQ